MPWYNAWPEPADIQLRLDAANVVLRLDENAAADRIALAIDEVTTEVEKRTLRQFIAASDVRRFDGTASPEIVVDEMTQLSEVRAFSSATDTVGTLYPYATLIREQGRPLHRIVVTSGAAYQAWPQIFPQGRQNIQVSGTFGYGGEIPHDLWNAVAGEIAFRLARELCFRPIGRVKEYKTLQELSGTRTEESVTYSLDSPSVLGWNTEYKRNLARYKRPEAYRNRYLRGRMA